MRAIASYILRGPMQAMLVTAVLAMLSMLRPPLTGLLGYISGAAIALVTLHVGSKQGLQVAAGAMLGAMLMAYFVLGKPMLAIAFGFMGFLVACPNPPKPPSQNWFMEKVVGRP